MIQAPRFTLKRAGGLAGLAGTLTLIGALATSQAASAAGNPSFEGILAADPPYGFTSSPAAYDVSSGPVTVAFNVVATNLTEETQTFALNFSADHILTDNGTNVADGQPGQPGITFNGPAGTTQAQIAGSQSFTRTWEENQTETLSLTYTFDTCGYFQLDVWSPWQGTSRGRATLASGFIRVLGCDPESPSPSPSASASPNGGVAPTSTPDAGVQAITTTPSTGAGSGFLTIGTGLLIVGSGMVVVGSLRRRTDV